MSTINCSNLDLPMVVGPKEMFNSMDHWSTAVYIILGLHVLPVWVMSTLILRKLPNLCPAELSKSLACLISIPPALMLLTASGILIPSIGKYIEIALEIVLSFGLVKFLQFSSTLCGGKDNLVLYCADRDLLLPIGSPPFVCLLPCTKPSVTKYKLSLVMWGPSILFGLKVGILAVDLLHLFIGYTPSGYFLDVDNIGNILNIPAGLGAIYCFNIYVSIINECLVDNTKRLLGTVILVEYILFDCLRLFFIFLTGTGMLTCVAPFLSQDLVVHLLKNIMKAFLATFIGIPFLKLCSEETIIPQITKTKLVDSMGSITLVEVKVNHGFDGEHDEKDQQIIDKQEVDSGYEADETKQSSIENVKKM